MTEKKNKFRLLGIDYYETDTEIYVAGILIPLNKVSLLKRFSSEPLRLMNNFQYHVIKIDKEQLQQFDHNDLMAKTYYNIWQHFKNLENVYVFADNFELFKEDILNRMKNLKLELNENWIFKEEAVKKYLVCSVAYLIAKYHSKIDKDLRQRHNTQQVKAFLTVDIMNE